jgi:hypothetical protein
MRADWRDGVAANLWANDSFITIPMTFNLPNSVMDSISGAIYDVALLAGIQPAGAAGAGKS